MGFSARSGHPLNHLFSPNDLPKGKPKAPQSGLVLLLVRAPTRILDQPCLIAPIERTSSRCVAATIRHHPTHNYPLYLFLTQQILKLGIDERVVGILANHRMVFNGLSDLRLEFPVLGADSDRARKTPLADQLVLKRRGEFLLGVAVLGEDEGPRSDFEVGDELEDVGEGRRGHGGEDDLPR